MRAPMVLEALATDEMFAADEVFAGGNKVTAGTTNTDAAARMRAPAGISGLRRSASRRRRVRCDAGGLEAFAVRHATSSGEAEVCAGGTRMVADRPEASAVNAGATPPTAVWATPARE